MNDIRISAFLLERYHIGEVTAEEKRFVEEAAAKDEILAAGLANLYRGDIDFRRRFPRDVFLNGISEQSVFPRFLQRNFPRRQLNRISPALAWGFSAAAAILVIAIPLFVFKNSAQIEFADRLKGKSSSEFLSLTFSGGIADNSSVDLSVYIRGSAAGEGIKLADQSGVREGNTVQLVYRVSDDNSDKKYGVIFSIDGRSHVTLHYPYNIRQDTQIVSGRNVPLDEAYTLDDAPYYEIFFFVTGNTPMDVRNILTKARQLARQIERQSNEADRLGASVFNEYNVKVFTLIKE